MSPPLFDISLKHSSTFLICGQTGSGKMKFELNSNFYRYKKYLFIFIGKSHFVSKILQKKDQLFKPSSPRTVILFYKAWQPLYDFWKKMKYVHIFIENLPDEEKIVEIFKKYKDKGGCIAIFDDLQGQVNDSIKNIFTIYSHHFNATIFLLVQSLFLENKMYRMCSLNAHYIVLMKNKRDAASVSFLARQVSPYHTKYITEAYMEATKNPYSYLLFDLRQETHDLVRLRSNIFSNRVSIYLECNKNKKKR